MLPRRCKKCSCFIAPHLGKCPRCGTPSKPQVAATKLTKEEKRAERVKRDEKVPVIHAKNLHWIPSKFSLSAHKAMVEELSRRLAKADSARARNTIRCELRLVKAHLARATVPAGKKGWTSETLHTKKVGCVSIFISPKNHKYVMAERDDEADLLIEPRKKNRSIGMIRLRRFEKSPFARMLKRDEQEEKVHSKRKKEKKAHRAKKRSVKSKSK